MSDVNFHDILLNTFLVITKIKSGQQKKNPHHVSLALNHSFLLRHVRQHKNKIQEKYTA